VLILAGLAAFVLLLGTPHVGWNYGCKAGPRFGQSGCKIWDWCEYYGIQGRQVIFPKYGESCSPVRLLPLRWP
jgi:hypothetical protein